MRQSRKKIVGITGGSGTGKSHLCMLLKACGYDIIDTDIIAKEVMEKGQDCLKEVAAEFGQEILENGNLNRKRLAYIVFSDEKKLKRLNEISHKYILACVENMIEKASSDIVFVDGAVLIESGFECDVMIGIVADYELRRMRIMKRDSLSEEEAERRINAQKPDEFYFENCDFVIRNSPEGFDIDDILKRIENEN